MFFSESFFDFMIKEFNVSTDVLPILEFVLSKETSIQLNRSNCANLNAVEIRFNLISSCLCCYYFSFDSILSVSCQHNIPEQKQRKKILFQYFELNHFKINVKYRHGFSLLSTFSFEIIIIFTTTI